MRVIVDSRGEMMLTTRPDGTWQVDSFFDISYQIDFMEGQREVSVRPQDGSTRTENHAEDVIMDNGGGLFERGSLSESESDERLVRCQPTAKRGVSCGS